MASVSLDFHRLSAQVHDLAVLSESADVDRINVDELINVEDHLSSALAHVRSLQNLFSPINRLPPEVLVNIISFIQPNVRSFAAFELPSSSQLHRWVKVLSVCRHWRRTARSAPSLWNRVYVDGWAERSEAWFSRTQDTPFKCYYEAPFPGDLNDQKSKQPGILLDIFSQISRMEELHVSSPWMREWRGSSLWGLLDQSAPILESLSLVMEGEGHLGDDADTAILPCIFKDDMPKLKNLSVAGFSSWPLNRFSNLTRFSFENQPVKARPSLPEFLAFLAASPNLQVLSLLRAGPTEYDAKLLEEVDRSAPVIALPQLEYLEIDDFCQEVTRGRHLWVFLKHLDIPATAVRCFWEEKTYFSAARYFTSTEEEGKRTLGKVKRIIMASHNTQRHSSFVALKDSTLYCNYSKAMPSLELPPDTTLLAGVEELVYVPSSLWDPQSLCDLLRLLPSLRTFKVTSCLWSKLSRVSGILSELNHPSSGAGTKFKYAPGLEELHIYPVASEERLQPDEGADSVVIMANVRANNGYPLKELAVGHFRDESIELLGDYIDWVISLSEKEWFGNANYDVFGQFGGSFMGEEIEFLLY